MTKQRSRVWAFVLLGSLALNLFLGGAIAARWVFRSSAPFDFRPFSMRRVVRVLGPEAEPVIKRVMSKHRGEIRERMRAAHDARMRAMETMSAEPLDKAKAEAEMAEFRQKSAAAQEAMHRAFIELAGELTPEQRKTLSESLRKRSRRPRRGKGRRFFWDRPPPASAERPPPSAELHPPPLPPPSATP